jgi:hypothetical protein
MQPMKMLTSLKNRDVLIVFEPKIPHSRYGRRFGISINNLPKYLPNNYQVVVKRMNECTKDSVRVKLRATGIIDVYFR